VIPTAARSIQKENMNK